jgi:hypothetical protein
VLTDMQHASLIYIYKNRPDQLRADPRSPTTSLATLLVDFDNSFDENIMADQLSFIASRAMRIAHYSC